MAQKGRKSGDGRGRLGGRAKGTPNKDNPLKGYLAAHSLDYFEPNITVTQSLSDALKADLKSSFPFPIGSQISQFDIDLAQMHPQYRVDAEIKLLNYHTPKMQTATVDMSVDDRNLNIEQRLARLAAQDDI